MDYTFIYQDQTRKRKANHGACDICKRKKKRCIHNESQSPASALTTTRRRDTDHEHGQTSTDPVPSNLEPIRHSINGKLTEMRDHTPSLSKATRFVGDLNPEASLLEHENAPSRDRNSIGTWLDIEREGNPVDEDGRSQSETMRAVHHHRAASEGMSLEPDLANDRTLSEHRLLLPDRASQSALLNIFLCRIHPLLPVIDEIPFRQDFSNGNASSVILQAICLLAGKDSNARPHLQLPGTTNALDSRKFASRLYQDLKRSLKSRRQHDRVHLIQALALVSLHSEGSDGAEEASMHLAQAIHHAQTIGLHLGRSHGQQSFRDKLFWSLRCLDVLNAATNGRPQMINHCDVGLQIEDVLESCSPSFRVMLALTRLLARVIMLYQPTSDPEAIGIETDFPEYETIVDQCAGWEIGPQTLASLELYYHGIAILSHRSVNSENNSLAVRASGLRQHLSALQIKEILDHTPLNHLLPFPAVPYAISLAMSCAYRSFRRSGRPLKQAVAKKQMECCIKALDAMARNFRSANTMAVLGYKVLEQMRRLERQKSQAAPGRESPQVEHGGCHSEAGISATPSNNEISNAAESYLEHLDSFADPNTLFNNDGTFQAMDTLFDNFLGLDLPADFFDISSADMNDIPEADRN